MKGGLYTPGVCKYPDDIMILQNFPEDNDNSHIQSNSPSTFEQLFGYNISGWDFFENSV